MANPKFHKTERSASGARHVSPQEQLWELTTERQHHIFREVFRRLKKRDQEDLCYGMIAYLHWGFRRPFESPFMQALYMGFIELIEGNSNNV